MMARSLLQRTGRALYGGRWRESFAAELNVSKERVDSWADGRAQIPDNITSTLASMVLERETELRGVFRSLQRELEK